MEKYRRLAKRLSRNLATMEEDVAIFIVDRKKDMINTAGFKVFPAEIERVVAAHPSVAMVAVGGAPDEIKGEIAKAYVVLKPGACPDGEGTSSCAAMSSPPTSSRVR
jgi:long-chain acyl-CoA synthetase